LNIKLLLIKAVPKLLVIDRTYCHISTISIHDHS